MLSRPLATALRATTKQQQQQWLPVTAAAHTRAPMTARRPLLQRSFASEPTIKRPKPIKVKKSEARRRVEPKAEDSVAASEQHPQNALTEARQAPPPSPYMPSEQQQQPTFGQMMKANFFWGIGMALAFSLVGAIFSSMEETPEPGKFDASEVIIGDEDDLIEDK